MSDRSDELLPVPTDAPDPRGLSRRDVRRIRVRQAVMALLSGSLLVVIVALLIVTTPWSLFLRSSDQNRVAQSVARGQLYLLDNQRLGEHSRLLIVEPARGESPVVKKLVVNYDPMIASSRDGSRVYIASKRVDTNTDILTVVDTATDSVIQEGTLDQPGKPQARVLHTGRSCCPDMAVSRDGRWLFVLQVTPGNEGDRIFMLGTYDTVAGRMLPESAPIGDCGPASILPGSSEREVHVVCTKSHEVHFLEIAEDGTAGTGRVLSLPDGVSWAVLSPDGAYIYAVLERGSVLIVDTASEQIVSTEDLNLPPKRTVHFGKVLLSQDGEELVLGIGTTEDVDVTSADEVLVVSVDDWQPTVSVPTTELFYSFALDPTGRRVYGIVVEKQSILVVDLEAGEQVGVLRGVGISPQLGVVHPQ